GGEHHFLGAGLQMPSQAPGGGIGRSGGVPQSASRPANRRRPATIQADAPSGTHPLAPGLQ
ncbi:MAG: hypothetical protein P8Z74_07925, partial [Acidobacteriota bacterium]